MNLYSPVISGSLTVTGSTSFIGNVTMTGTVSATASNATLLNGTGSVGFATTSSFTTTSGSVSSRITQIETVYATTGSNSFRATQSITGSLTVTGQITAQTLNVQQVTSSILYSSGSNVFGCDINSRQTFTGSFFQTGSVACFSNCLIIGGALSGTNATFSSCVGIGTSPSFPFDLLVSSSGNFNTIAQIFNNDFTACNRSYLRVRQQVNSGGSVSSYFGAGQDSNLYIIANNSARGGDLIINGATGAATFVSSVGVGGSPSGTYGTLSVFGGISTKDDNNGKLEIGRYSSGASNSYIKLGANSNSLRITNKTDNVDIFTIENGGNVGIGTTPSAWASPFTVIQGGTFGQHVGFQSNGPDMKLGSNNYYNGSAYLYTVSNNGAAQLNIGGNSGFQFNVAGCGTANATVTFTTPLVITGAGNVGICNQAPLHNLDIGSVRTNTGGFAFCNMVTAQGVFSTFACVGSDANVITTITYTNTNDHNRSGVFVARWAYNASCAALFIVSCLWNDSQNIVTLAFRNFQSGALQICVSGGGGDYRVQALTQGTKAT